MQGGGDGGRRAGKDCEIGRVWVKGRGVGGGGGEKSGPRKSCRPA